MSLSGRFSTGACPKTAGRVLSMKSLKTLALSGLVALAGLTMSANSAYAAASYCVPGPNSDGLTLSQVTFQGSNADQCYGIVSTNAPSASSVETWFSDATLGTGSYLGGVANGSTIAVTNAMSMQFLLTPLDVTSGTWTLKFTDPVGAPTQTFPAVFDIVLGLENDVWNSSNDQWALYMFNDESIAGTGPANGTWQFNYSGNSLDSAKLFIRNGTPGGTGAGSTQAVVPEPASLLLLGTGLSAAAWRARRKKNTGSK